MVENNERRVHLHVYLLVKTYRYSCQLLKTSYDFHKLAIKYYGNTVSK